MKIALEEHFLTPNLVEHWKSTLINISPSLGDKALNTLMDFGERRLAAMDDNGIAYAILSISGPGVQIEPDTRRAIDLAREANDMLATEIQKRPKRFGGLAHVALQNPKAAADELERCVNELGFCGAMVNGHSLGIYLDDDRFEPFWERAAALNAPIYIHPANPVDRPTMYTDHSELWGPVWSWGVETATHALRLVFAGVFERHPKAMLILGHMGEAIPFQLWRIDSRWQIANRGGRTLPKPPSHYLRTNLLVTTSGAFSLEPLNCALGALGEDKVMFSADYPFENVAEAAHFIDTAPISEGVRNSVTHANAKRWLRIPALD